MRRRFIESLERRQLLAFDLHVNCQPSGTPVPTGYVADTGATFGNRGNGFSYGWNASASSATRDRNSSKSPDQRYDTFVHTQLYGTRTWEAAVPDGDYVVHLVAGDPSYSDSAYKFNAEGVLALSGTPSSANPWVEGEATVHVTDGRLTITNASGANNNKLGFIDISSVESSSGVTVTATDNTATEGGDAGKFTITRTGDTSADLLVSYTLAGTATNGVDYNSLPGSVTIPAGSASAVVTVTPIDDQIAEPDENVILTLQDGSGYVGGSSDVVTIFDNDSAQNTFNAKINFQPASATAPSGYLVDSGKAFGTRGNGFSYGWSGDNTANTRDRNSNLSPDQRYDTLDHFRTFKWELAVPTGQYTVHVVVGDPSYTDSVYGLDAEGTKIVGGTPTAQQHWFEATKAVTVSDGRLTLTNAAGSSNNRICFIDVSGTGQVQHGNTIAWTTAASSPIARSEAMTVTIDDKMYVFGGYTDSTFTPTKRVDVYDPAKNTWTRLTDSDMPVALTHSGCTLVGRNVVIAGGYPAKSGGGQTFSTTGVWSWNVDTHVWTSLPPLPSARGGGALADVDGTLHFFGGSDSNRTDADTHWALAPGANQWTTLASIPTKRNHMGAVTLNGKIYAVGGQQNQDANEIPQAAVEVYDPATNQWSTAASLPFGRSHVAAATLLVDGRIVVLGGEKTFNSVINNVVAYDPALDQWTEMTALPSPRNSGVAAYIDGELIYSTGRLVTTTYRGIVS